MFIHVHFIVSESILFILIKCMSAYEIVACFYEILSMEVLSCKICSHWPTELFKFALPIYFDI